MASCAIDMEGSSDKLFCCRWVRHRVPLAHREELYHILRMTGPLVRIGLNTVFCLYDAVWTEAAMAEKLI